MESVKYMTQNFILKICQPRIRLSRSSFTPAVTKRAHGKLSVGKSRKRMRPGRDYLRLLAKPFAYMYNFPLPSFICVRPGPLCGKMVW